MAPRLSWSVLSGLLLLSCLAVPSQSGTLRDEETSTGKLANPFQSGDESHRLLQSYIVSILNKEESQSRPEINSREQEVFFLFHLHDYDRSGFLDGLEMIRLLSDYNAFYKPAVYHYNEVVSLVDFLLQTQDLSHDGLFTPSELLSPPLLQAQEEEEAVEDPNEQTETMATPVHQGQPEI